MKDLNFKSQTMKLQQENIGEILQGTGKSISSKSKNRQMGLYQAKKLLHSRGNNRIKVQPME